VDNHLLFATFALSHGTSDTQDMKQDTLTDTQRDKLASMLNFARAHDWGQKSLIPYASCALHIYDDYTGEIVKFYDMEALKAWAGY